MYLGFQDAKLSCCVEKVHMLRLNIDIFKLHVFTSQHSVVAVVVFFLN